MLVIVTLADGRELTIVKKDAEADALRLKDDLERWRDQGMVVSLATHEGLFEISTRDVVQVRVVPRAGHPKRSAVPNDFQNLLE